MNDSENTNRLRRRLIAGGAGLLAGAGLGMLSRGALAQAATVESPMANGRRNWWPFPRSGR